MAISLLCTGCWDSTEIDQLAIVTASGLDLVTSQTSSQTQDSSQSHHSSQSQESADSEEPSQSSQSSSQGQMNSNQSRSLSAAQQGQTMYRGIVQIARPSEFGSSGGGAPTTPTGSTQAFALEIAEGRTPSATLEKIRRRVSRRLFMGQRRVVVIGEDFARQGVMPIVDEIIRNPQSRLRTYIVIAYHTTAERILTLPYTLNRLPSDAVVDLEQRGVVPVDVKQFAQRLAASGDTFALGIEPIKSRHDVSDQSSETFTLSRVALFQGDKLVGWLNQRQSEGFVWIYGRARNAVVIADIAGDAGGTVSARLLRANTSRKVRVMQGHLAEEIQCHADFTIVENDSKLNLNDPKNIQIVRAGLEKAIVERMTETVSAVKKMQSDAFCVSDQIDKRYPQLWRRLKPHWRETYSKLPFVVRVEVDIQNSGLTGAPLKATNLS